MEQRRAQRYKLQLPLRILQVNEERLDRTEKTRDISSGGVCFTSQARVDVGGRIEYVITLSGSTPPVRIRCQLSPQAGEFEIAVTMERYSFVRPDEFSAFGVNL